MGQAEKLQNRAASGDFSVAAVGGIDWRGHHNGGDFLACSAHLSRRDPASG
jgi:hypothetical protein